MPSTRNVGMSFVLLLAAMHAVSLAVAVPASRSSNLTPTPAEKTPSCAGYQGARRSVRKSLARAKEMVGLVTQMKAKLEKEMPRLGFLDDCIELNGLSADYLTAVGSDMAKGGAGGRKLGESAIRRIISQLSATVTNEDTCLEGFDESDEGSDPRLAGLRRKLAQTGQQFSVTLDVVSKALN